MATGELSWSTNNGSVFSLKSAYGVARFLAAQSKLEVPEQSDNSQMKAFWKTIWKLPLPRKIKLFIWKGFQGALPTGAQMFKHHLPVSTSCPVCQFRFEDEKHIFSQCWWTASLWQLLNIRGSEIFNRFLTFSDLLFFYHHHMVRTDFLKVIVACWYTWHNRNLAAHNSPTIDPRLAYYRVHALLSDFISKKQSHIFEASQNTLEWSRPPQQVFKINIDGSWCNETRIGGVGMLARDSNGVVAAVRGFQVTLCDNALDVEGAALKEAFQLAREMKLTNVIFESDCYYLVTSLNTKVIDSVWQKDWFTYCSSLLLHEKNWSIVLIRREANVAADSIARYFRCSGGQWTRLDAVPRLLFNVQSF
ncbi:hypothetical protein QQ045_031946 [Rhodiola kirilowii]